MLFKTLTVTGTIATLVVSAAVAAPPAGKGKPASAGEAAGKGKPAPTGTACKPKISVIIKGTLVANGAPASVALTVTRGNRFANAYRAATQPLTVLLTLDTKITRGDSHDPAGLQAGDLLNVRAVVCKADLAHSATPPLTAVRLVAHPAKP